MLGYFAEPELCNMVTPKWVCTSFDIRSEPSTDGGCNNIDLNQVQHLDQMEDMLLLDTQAMMFRPEQLVQPELDKALPSTSTQSLAHSGNIIELHADTDSSWLTDRDSHELMLSQSGEAAQQSDTEI